MHSFAYLDEIMKYTFACADIGMNCGFKAEDSDKNKLLEKIRKHAKEAHGMSNIDNATLEKIQKAIKTV